MQRKLLSLIVVFCIADPAAAQEHRSPATLQGLQRVFFRSSSFGGVSKESVAKLVETDLREAGISLVSEQEWQAVADVGRLELTLTLTCRGKSCGYTVRLNLDQRISLIRKKAISDVATTWADGYQNAIDQSEIPSLPPLISIDVQTLVKTFLADFREANRLRTPKP